MGFKVEEDDSIPVDSKVKCRLEKVEEKTIRWNDRKTGEERTADIIEWSFKVQEGEFQGRWVNGSCDAKLSMAEGNKFREWSEALLQTELSVDMELELEDLEGLSAWVLVGSRQGSNGKTYINVADVIPLAEASNSDVPF
jgi:hypothetical protein